MLSMSLLLKILYGSFFAFSVRGGSTINSPGGGGGGGLLPLNSPTSACLCAPMSLATQCTQQILDNILLSNKRMIHVAVTEIAMVIVIESVTLTLTV